MELPQFPPILSVKLKNTILKAWPEGKYYLHFKLKNIRVNQSKRGCSGFIMNTANKTIVYVCSEPIYCGYMRRYADSFDDYGGRGGYNQYSRNLDQYALDIVSMLKKG